MKGKDYINKMQTHQYEDIYKSDDVPFQDLSKGTARRMVNFGVGLFTVLLLLSFIIKIPREVHIPFELKGGLSESIYQYPEEIYIEDFFVETNDLIIRGDTLVNITSDKIVKYLEELETWRGKYELYQNSKKEANEKSVDLLKSKMSGYTSEIQKVGYEKTLTLSAQKKEGENLKLQLENTQKQHERNISLHKNDVISDLEFENSVTSLQIAKQTLTSNEEKYALLVAELDSRLQQLKNSKNQLKVEVDKLQAEIRYEIDEINKNRDLATKKMELNYGPFNIRGNAIQLISPINGKVTLRSENERHLNSGEILIRLQTDSLKYYAFAEAETKDIGLIKSGTKAVLKFKSFPHYYYGTMHANVLSISPSPSEKGFFPVKLEITDQGKLEEMVTKGMTGTASFVVEEKTVFDYILKAFLKVTSIDQANP